MPSQFLKFVQMTDPYMIWTMNFTRAAGDETMTTRKKGASEEWVAVDSVLQQIYDNVRWESRLACALSHGIRDSPVTQEPNALRDSEIYQMSVNRTVHGFIERKCIILYMYVPKFFKHIFHLAFFAFIWFV